MVVSSHASQQAPPLARRCSCIASRRTCTPCACACPGTVRSDSGRRVQTQNGAKVQVLNNNFHGYRGSETAADVPLAEREGFEPPIRLPVCRISSAVHSTTLPPLQSFEANAVSALPSGRKWPLATALLPNLLASPVVYRRTERLVNARGGILLHSRQTWRIEVQRNADAWNGQALARDLRMHA